MFIFLSFDCDCDGSGSWHAIQRVIESSSNRHFVLLVAADVDGKNHPDDYQDFGKQKFSRLSILAASIFILIIVVKQIWGKRCPSNETGAQGFHHTQLGTVLEVLNLNKADVADPIDVRNEVVTATEVTKDI